MTDAPASASGALAPFSFIGADHPFAAGLDRFAAHVDPSLVGPGATVHADRTTRPAPDGGLVLHRVYWSVHARGPAGFSATTLAWSAKRDRATWLSFPDDPDLPALPELAARATGVLRYLPQRRCTLRVAEGIGKVKRPDGAAERGTRLSSSSARSRRRPSWSRSSSSPAWGPGTTRCGSPGTSTTCRRATPR